MTDEHDTGNPARLSPEERNLIPFDAAFGRLRTRFPDTTPGEVAMWVSSLHGLPAYRVPWRNAPEWPEDDEERDDWDVRGTAFFAADNLPVLDKLRTLFFSPADVESFEPSLRWLTLEQLAARWGGESRVMAYLKAGKADVGDNAPLWFYPFPTRRDAPLDECLFCDEQIEWVENRFGLSPLSSAESTPTGKGAVVQPTTTNAPKSEPATVNPLQLHHEIALVPVEDGALQSFQRRHKRNPTFDEFWDWFVALANEDDETIKRCTDTKIVWVGKDGNQHETGKDTMRNRFTQAKKRRPFP